MMKVNITVLFLFLMSVADAQTWQRITMSSAVGTGTAGTPLQASECPTGYVLVPKNATFTAVDFCVAKYEMKDDGYGTAVSQATGTPWVSVTRTAAREACQALGQGHDLISNDQWQTIARNITGTGTNWSSGTVASGTLNQGHSDNSPNNALAAVTDDNDPCNGTGQTCTSATWDAQRRTHTLSNASVIWDFAGNVSEWVTNNSNVTNGVDEYLSTISALDLRQRRYGTDATAICNPGWDATPYCGFGYGFFNGSAGAIFRGGDWSALDNAGVFYTNLTADSTTSSAASRGFRCVYVP